MSKFATYMRSKKITITLFTFLIAVQPRCVAWPQGSTQAPAPITRDVGWPRQVSRDGAVLIYYQPQIDAWKDYKELMGRVAFSLTPQGGKQGLGVASFQAGTIVDKDTRTVFLRDVAISSVRFPSLDRQTARAMEELFRKMAPTTGEPISVDRLMADLEKSKVATPTVALKNDPPQIFYSAGPAVLLMVQGEPVLAPIEKIKLQFVVNTNWDLFFDKSNKDYYLLVNKAWLTAKDLKGPWTQTQTLPKDMSRLPAGQNFDDVRSAVPPPPPSSAVPQIFFASTPAELIVFKGAPVYSKIPGTRLLYVANTDNDVFVDSASKEFYLLLSGRWFRSKELGGPWSYAGNDLPGDFSKIPGDSPKARVLASVPGTIEAADAVMLAQIPATVVVNKTEAEAKVHVTYDGAPQFKPIEKTSLQYATNTQDKVIKVGDLYYLCFQGVWFMSTTPNGPWKTVDSVPKEIYEIPPSSPVYNVTYVTQTNSTSDTVECSSTGGYLGMFVIGMAAGATIAYGTGYYYPPYAYWGPTVPYPIYRPWPATYGVGAVYNPWYGGWASGRAAYGPYGAAGSSAWYNPATGRYGRSASAQGWYGGRSVASSYNPWTGAYGATSQSHNAYSQWGRSAVARGDQWARTGHVSTARGTTAAYQTSSGRQGTVTRGVGGTVARTSNGVYAGRDGNVYRSDSQGNWSRYDNGNWNRVDSSQSRQQVQQNLQNRQRQSTMEGLTRSAEARQRGQTQTERFQNQAPRARAGGRRVRR
jgi:hypothetical protein